MAASDFDSELEPVGAQRDAATALAKSVSPEQVLWHQLFHLREVLLGLRRDHERDHGEVLRLRVLYATSKQSSAAAEAAAESLRSTICSLQEERDSLRSCVEEQTRLQAQVLESRGNAKAAQEETAGLR